MALIPPLCANCVTLQAAAHVLELLAIGVFVVARDARLLFANSPARQFLAQRKHIRLRGERIAFSGAKNQKKLFELLQKSHQEQWGGHQVIHLTQTLARGTVIGPSVHIVPIHGQGERTKNDETVALFIRSPEELPFSDQGLRAQFGFTAAESALAAALASGISLAAYAETRKVSMNTVRSQLKGVLRKTCTKRQSDAVRVLLGTTLPLLGR